MTDFIAKVQRRIANIAIPASFRAKGSGGAKHSTIKFFVEFDLREINHAADMRRYHDAETDKLLERFPNNWRKWGVARKSLNLFGIIPFTHVFTDS